VQNNSCDLDLKPGTRALAELLTDTYPSTHIGSTTRTCGTDTMVSYSEHYDGRSIDWAVNVEKPAERRLGMAFVRWLVRKDSRGVPGGNARRLGVMYIIWNNQQWCSWAPERGWFDYRNCTEGKHGDNYCHRNHVHVTLSWAGAMGRTSWWTKDVAARDFGPCRPADLNWSRGYAGFNPTPCPRYARVTPERGSSTLHKKLVRFSGITVRRGMDGPVVKAVQELVRADVVGAFGRGTKARVARWQTRHGLVGDGVVGYNTWRAALEVTAPIDLSPYYRTKLRRGDREPAVRALKRTLGGLPDDRVFGRGTERAVNDLKRSNGFRVDGLVGYRTWHVLNHDYAPWYDDTLRRGDRGRKVKVLQNALGGLVADGIFGRATVRAVNTVKRANDLRVDGIAGRRTWKALSEH
jgi:peptidoglycan hydrolase-like protein with peptidoglycan-binding domain